MTMIYSLSDVCHRYGKPPQQVAALSNVSLEVQRGEFLALADPSGSGKATLLNLLGLLETPAMGAIKINGKDANKMTGHQRDLLRWRHLGFIFQTLNLIPVLSAFENVEYFLLRSAATGRDVKREVMEALGAVGMTAQAQQRPMEMSGGQRQRVAVVRALVRKPAAALADEPTASLDHQTDDVVIQTMKRLNQERQVTFIFSTHDPKVLAAASRVVYLEDGWAS